MTHINVTKPMAACVAHPGDDGEVRIGASDSRTLESVELSLTPERALILTGELIDAVQHLMLGTYEYQRLDAASENGDTLPSGVDGHPLGRAS